MIGKPLHHVAAILLVDHIVDLAVVSVHVDRDLRLIEEFSQVFLYGRSSFGQGHAGYPTRSPYEPRFTVPSGPIRCSPLICCTPTASTRLIETSGAVRILSS